MEYKPNQTAPLFETEFVAEKGTARRLALAMLQTVPKNGRTRSVVLVMLGLWVGFGLYAGTPALWYLGGLGTVAVVLGLQFLLLWRAGSNTYPEHSVHNSSFSEQTMTLTGPNGVSELPLASFDRVYLSGAAAVLRRRKGKSLAALPIELVPPGAVLLFHTPEKVNSRKY